ncbi:MAG: endopeptidase La [Bacteroidota bacterium]
MTKQPMFLDTFFLDQLSDDGEFPPILALNDEEEGSDEGIPTTLPILALKNTVLYPGVVLPITIGRDKSIKAVKAAHEEGKFIAVLSQKEVENEDPGVDDLHHFGCVARLLKMLKMPDGSTTAILQGRVRGALGELTQDDPYMAGTFAFISDERPDKEMELDAILSSIKDKAKRIIELSPQIPSEASAMLDNMTNKSFLINFIASNLNLNIEEKQLILEISSLTDRGKSVLKHLDAQLQLLELRSKIENKVRVDIEKQQRDYFLNQQLKTIQEELGQNPQQDELNQMVKRAKKMKWPSYAKEQFYKELNKAKRINPQVAEYSVTLNYLEMLLDLPWENYTKDNFDLKRVRKVLDKDHYGLEEVKDRIIEHLAVLKLKGDMKAPIICLVGPPGVGKTSLGRSIAKALKRKFVRMSLGGLHDESEIRGHRKTYIGAMPGRIIQSLKKAGSSNPVFILDEIDKIGKDFRGDPSSALLEVLDPEQNETFSDNYLELEYDLSNVMFIATANGLGNIQPALRDRMEIIQISGYSIEEKVHIAQKHLLPEQRENHGLKANQVSVPKGVLQNIIQSYTRESGVRSLSRQLAGVMRHTAKRIAVDEEEKVVIKKELLKDILGPTKFSHDKYTKLKTPGVAIGLAWTQVGGDVLYIEASLHKGKGKLTLTGNLGDVMKESATTALSYIKAHADELRIEHAAFEENDIHIHVPEGAIPKDGPSAGITMLTALTSALREKPVNPYLAMTGEITLRGQVLPVGGIKEKVLAAKRSGIKTIILCEENQKHVEQIPEDFVKGVEFIFVDRMEDVLKHAIS